MTQRCSASARRPVFDHIRLAPLLALLFMVTAQASPVDTTVLLDTLDLSKAQQGWGRTGAGVSVEGHPLTIQGRAFERGLGVHSAFKLFVSVGGQAKRFRAWVGVDDEVRDGTPASVEFLVLGDGQVLFESGVMRAADEARAVDVSIEGVEILCLVVTEGGDNNRFDHADWGDAKVILGSPFEVAAIRPPPRWRLDEPGGIAWNAEEDPFLPHRDHIELSGHRVAAILRYGAGGDGSLHLTRQVVWPMLRTLPENTHAFVMHDFGPEFTPRLSLNGRAVETERLMEARIDGTLTLTTFAPLVAGTVGENAPGLEITRVLFPARDLPMLLENVTVTNRTGASAALEIAPPDRALKPDPERSRYGEYRLETLFQGAREVLLADGDSCRYCQAIHGRRVSDPVPAVDGVAEERARRAFVASLREKLILETPDPVLNRLFAFAKVRATESIFATKGGLMHGPGGGRYYAAIWANDQAEYVNPFFGFLGDPDGIESARNSFRQFAGYMNDAFRPIPSSIISQGEGFWNGVGDRGDQAMIAYGAARFAMAAGDRETAESLWPLITWCLEYCNRKVNEQGVVESDCDELEHRFPAGDANLCTACLYLDALISAIRLGVSLDRSLDDLEKYFDRADALLIAIEAFFGAEVEGYRTYRYYAGNERLRAWISIPLTVGIHDRAEGTVDALFSDRLWTEDGLATRSGDPDFWDRSTLYALRGVLAAGAADRGLPYLTAYSLRRLLGEHVPYPVEACPEGGQRHLSAESGLYCRIFTEGLFGIRPEGLRRFTMIPRLPGQWDRMALKRIHAFGNVFDVIVERTIVDSEPGVEVSVATESGFSERFTKKAGEKIVVVLP